MEDKKVVVNGACRFCGQIREIEYTEDELLERIRIAGKVAEDIADDDATRSCTCKAAQAAKEKEDSLYSCELII